MDLHAYRPVASSFAAASSTTTTTTSTTTTATATSGMSPMSSVSSRVRWLPGPLVPAYATSHWALVTGSAIKTQNGLRLWACPAPDLAQRAAPVAPTLWESAGLESAAASGWASAKSGFDVQCLTGCSTPNYAAVVDMEFINDELLLVGSDDGSVSVYSVTPPEADVPMIQLTTLLPRVHRYPCTAVSVQPNQTTDPELLSAGEDGQIFFYHLNADAVTGSLNADNMPISDVSYITGDTLVSVSASSQLKIWDRRKLQAPMLLQEYGKLSAMSCCAVHPSRVTKIATGTLDGRLTCWDLRNLSQPETVSEQLHSSDVWEVMFYRENPSYLLSCSEDGSIGVTHFVDEGVGERSRQLRSLFGNKLSVNSIDTRNNALVAVTDNFSFLFRLL